MKVAVLVAVALANFVVGDDGKEQGTIQLFSENEFEGLFYEGAVTPDCTTLWTNGNDQASSVRVQGSAENETTCVIVYEHYRCTGQMLEVTVDWPYPKLECYNFDKIISSFKAC